MEEDDLAGRNKWGKRFAVAFVILAFPLAAFLFAYQMTDWFRSEPENTEHGRKETTPTPENLTEAIKYGDQAKVEWYISQGVDLNAVSDELLPLSLPLATAIELRRHNIAKLLLDAGASPNAYIDDEFVGFFNDLPLNLAVGKSDRVSTKLLLEAGADPNLFAEYSGPSLHLALGGPRDIMKLLLDHGAQIDAPDKLGRTALHSAAQIGSERPLEFLIVPMVLTRMHKTIAARLPCIYVWTILTPLKFY